MNKWGKFVLGVVVGAVIVTGIIATCSERVTVGKAEALVQNEYGDNPTKEARDTHTDECVTGSLCVLWKQDWHAQPQRINGAMTIVEVFGWRCIGWENTPGYYPATEPFCRNRVREAGR